MNMQQIKMCAFKSVNKCKQIRENKKSLKA
nr:MAG TPA: hypothetical protein [Caudoviricetes sp.]